MKSNFIKWMCEKAEGFEFVRKQSDDEYYIGVSKYGGFYFDGSNYERFILPLLLQRAMQYYMSSNSHWSVERMCDLIKALRSDAESEKFLQYIYKQEKKG